MPASRTARASGTPKERASAAAQERDYTLQWVGPPSAAPAHAAPITGRTAGHVEASEGLYLFSPLAGDGHAGANDANGANGALCRVFVPRSAYTRCEFGASVEELAARHWIAGPAALLDALARQGRQAVIPLGQSLLALGLRCSRAMKPASERMCSHHSGAPWPGQASAPACASPASTRAMPVAVGAHQRMGAAAPRCIRR